MKITDEIRKQVLSENARKAVKEGRWDKKTDEEKSNYGKMMAEAKRKKKLSTGQV